MLHTLFQTSIKYPSIKRFDEHFCVDLVVEDGRVQGVVAIEIATGEFRLIEAKAVIIATGGAGRVFRENTNGGIVTGDGMYLPNEMISPVIASTHTLIATVQCVNRSISENRLMSLPVAGLCTPIGPRHQ